MRRLLATAFSAVIGAALLASPAHADQKRADPLSHFGFQGLFGSYDKATLQKGFVVYQTDCASCHGLRLVHYRDLRGLGLNAQDVAGLAAGAKVPKGMGGNGKPKLIAATPDDRILSLLTPAQAAKRFNGAVPRDLSLAEAAHPGGARYIYALLTGYRAAPDNMLMLPHHYFNTAASGMQTAMAPPLKPGSVTLANGKKLGTREMAHDVAEFLAWTADPSHDDRKSTGYGAMFFLLFLGILVYAARFTTRRERP